MQMPINYTINYSIQGRKKVSDTSQNLSETDIYKHLIVSGFLGFLEYMISSFILRSGKFIKIYDDLAINLCYILYQFCQKFKFGDTLNMRQNFIAK